MMQRDEARDTSIVDDGKASLRYFDSSFAFVPHK
jgi:hypothetical protein